MLKVNSINFKYPGKRNLLIKKVRFQVNKGEQLYLCGKSGQGKSTLLKIIAGILEPTAGTIRLGNERVFGPKFSLVPGHDEIKLVNQEFKLMANHTIFENIIHHLDYYTAKEKSQRAKQLGSILEITHLFEKLPKELSGGEKQRVAIAQALALPPQVLLLDEPFAHLDFQTQEKTQGLVNDLLREEKITSITVTHHPIDALKHADKIMFFHEGSIIDEGTPKRLYQNPRTFESASFFGPLNKISGSIYIRPEHLFESPKGANFQITKKFFLGQFWEYEIVNDKVKWNWVSSLEFNQNTRVKLSFSEAKTIRIT